MIIASRTAGGPQLPLLQLWVQYQRRATPKVCQPMFFSRASLRVDESFDLSEQRIHTGCSHKCSERDLQHYRCFS